MKLRAIRRHLRRNFLLLRHGKIPQEPYLTETYKAEVHPRQNEVQIVDIEISLHAPKDQLEFTGDIGLGYLAVEMEHRKAVNADTRMGALEVNGKVSAWGTLCGLTTAEHAAVGVAIFSASGKRRDNFLC